MKNRKKGVSLAILVISILIMSMLASVIIGEFVESNLLEKTNNVLDNVRIRELEYGISQIKTDFHMLVDDETISTMTLEEYILKRLRVEYNLSADEEKLIDIDENGKIVLK